MDTATLKTEFKAPFKDYVAPTVYLASLSLYGLQFYPAIIITLFLLLESWKKDRIEFVVRFTLLVGCYGFTDPDRNFGFKPSDVAIVLSFIAFLLYRKKGVVGRIALIICAYIAIMILFALLSAESMSIQMLQIRNYSSIVYVFFVLFVWADNSFDIAKLWHTVILYSLVICCFYIIDGFILNGYVMIPNTVMFSKNTSYFYDVNWAPFTLHFTRKYPPGLYLLSLAVYPVARYYKLSLNQWIIVVLALIACRTMTFIAALAIGYIVSAGFTRRFLKYSFVVSGCFVALFFVDRITGNHLRIASTVDQFTNFVMPEEQFDGEQIEGLVTFGSGRLEQVIPKLYHQAESRCLLTGFGFLHPQKTTAQQFIIDNPLYSDISASEEVVTGVEVTQIQTILDIGILGFAIQTAVFLLLYFVVRKSPESLYFGSMLVIFFIAGLGGFSGWINYPSLYLIAISWAAIVCQMKIMTKA
ncbi:MAG: hypothetical protein K2N79_04385 [Muribaculaceae bacterium]|nr:hypothetical protein [Muribaculaceae bacterium]MDE7370116.1 hypothetical protein [Muribaculaceae bacterium]